MAKDKSETAKAPARRRRKACLRNVEVITLQMREDKARQELYKFYDAATEAEKKIIGKLKLYGPDAEHLMRDARRLLNESIAKCKVIPFPQNRACKDSSESKITVFVDGQKYEF